VSPRRKLALLGRSLAEAALPRRASSEPPLREARFLIDAVALAVPPSRQKSPWSVEDRLVWVLDLFERLARAEQVGSGGA
jgi:phytoene synthase